MEFRTVSPPPFRAAPSGVDKESDFSPEGALGRFHAYFTAIRPGRYELGRIIAPAELIGARGRAQMEALIPIRLKKTAGA